MTCSSHHIILYSNINKLLTWSIAEVSKRNREGSSYLRTFSMLQTGLLIFYSSIWEKKKGPSYYLLSREEISSRKATQAGELHSQLPVRQLRLRKSLGREIAAVFTQHTRCMLICRSLTTGVVRHKLASTSHLWLRWPAPWRSSKS